MKKIILFLLITIIFLSCASRYEKLDEAGKEMYKEIAYIASKKELETFMELPADKRAQWLETFWKKRDPTPTTEENERREEHFRRIEYANEHFSLDVAGIPGWKTDIGRIYIKYGAPDKIENKDIGLRQTWIYYSYGLRYNFDEFGRILHPFPGDQEYEVFINSQLNAPLDAFQLGGGRFKANFDYATFYETPEKATLEIYYEIPLKELSFPADDSLTSIRIEERLAIFDTTGLELEQFAEKRKITRLETPKIVDGIETMELKAGTYQIAFSLVDLNTEKTANFRKLIEIPHLSDSLSLSDTQLAKLITTEKGNDLFRKGDYTIIPNPTATYQKGENLYIYYEVYNLQTDENGNYNFSADYLIRGKNLLWDTLLYEKEYSVESSNPEVIEALSLSDVPFDTYSLVIKIVDENTKNQTTSNTKLFNIIGWSVY